MLTRALVRARWQDPHDDTNEQAAGSGYSQAASRDTSQWEIRARVEQGQTGAEGQCNVAPLRTFLIVTQKVTVAVFEQVEVPASQIW